MTAPAADIDVKPVSRTGEGRLVLILGICGFASTFTMRLMDPIVPDLAREFQRSVPDVALFTSAFALAYALSQPVLGPVGDAFGKVKMIRIAAAVLGLMLIASAFAQTYGQMLVLRTVSGMAAGGIIPLAFAAIGDRVAFEERQVVIGRMLVMMILGQMSGSAFSGIVSHQIGWRTVFLVAAALSLTAATLSLLFLKPRGERPPAPSLSGVIVGYRGLFANPRTLPLYLLVMIEGAFAFGSYPYIAGVLAERSGTGSAEAGIVIGAAGIGGLCYGFLVGRLVQSLGVKLMTRLGGLLMGAALLTFALPLPWWTAIPIFFLHGFAFYLLHNNLQTRATDLSETHRGSAVALFAASFFTGHSIGPPTMGELSHWLGAPGAIVVLGVGLIGVGLLAPYLLGFGRNGDSETD